MDVPVRCRLSDPAHPHFLSRRDNPPLSECSCIGSGGNAFKNGDFHYYCDICELVFHQSCEIVPVIRHPYHLNHMLSVTFRLSETETRSFSSFAEFRQFFMTTEIDYDRLSEIKFEDRCDWCGEILETIFHRCLVCGFSLGESCFSKDPPFTITSTKRHQHPLNLFPRPLAVPCTACGLCDKKKEPGYVCLQCNYFVHQSCIDLPGVIKLTRHSHRLSYTPCLPPPTKLSCGVCRGNIDIKYGMYTCNKGCSYAIHSTCATHKDIWDGIDLEGVPEEPEEDLSPFKDVGYNLIKHFLHEHNLRYSAEGLNRDANEECQICCRSIGSGGFYRCTILHCDFFLHALCANFPKKKELPFHKHPLILQANNSGYTCHACDRVCSGFNYTCPNISCKEDEDDYFKIDVSCASICEPMEHQVHQHPLYLFSGRADTYRSRCGTCNNMRKNIFSLKCNDCEFTMCFKCATIPVLISHKYDEHLLTLSVSEDSSDPFWCEICERKIDLKNWFYKCNQCCTTLHTHCLFMDTSYVNIGWSAEAEGHGLRFASNNGNSRPVCDTCRRRCPHRGVFKMKRSQNKNMEEKCFCCFMCLKFAELPSSSTGRSHIFKNLGIFTFRFS